MSTPASAMWSSTPVSFPSLDTPAPSDMGSLHRDQLHLPTNHRIKRNRPIHDPQPTSSFLLTPASNTSATMSDDFPLQRPGRGGGGGGGGGKAMFDMVSASSSSRHSAPFGAPLSSQGSIGPLRPASLRALVRQALAQHRYAAAIFYADKLCSLVSPLGFYGRRSSSTSPTVAAHPPLSRVLLLCRCYHANGEYRRAIHALRTRTVVCPPHTAANTAHDMDDVWQFIQAADEQNDDEITDDNDDNTADDESSKENHHTAINSSMTDTDKLSRRQPSSQSAASAVSARARLVLECWLLLSTCLFRCRDYEDALLVLGADDSAAQHQLNQLADTLQTDTAAPTTAAAAPAPLLASIASHRADIYSQQQNRTKACYWYRQALRYDVEAVDAFDRLVEGRMQSYTSERTMMDELQFNDGNEWLRLVYWNKVQQYDTSSTHSQHTTAAPTATPASAVRSGGEGGVVERLSVLSVECGVVDNVELYSALVHQLYQRYDTAAALTLSSRLLTLDPYNPHLLPLHLLLLTATHNTSHLFYISHQLSSSLPSSPLSLYAIALYYYSIRRLDLARRFLSRCSALDPLFPLPWLAFGHCWAEEDESDQALAAYRTAARLFEGSHLPLLCLGMEYMRTGNTSMAAQLLESSYRVWPTDPLVVNELGVLAYQQSDWGKAADLFRAALSHISSASAAASTGGTGNAAAASAWSITSCNLGHALRKLRSYTAALAAYQEALAPPQKGLGEDRLAARAAGGGVSQLEASSMGGGGGGGLGDVGGWYVVRCIAFVYHLMGDWDAAILHYHRALAVRPRDTMTSDLLNRALQETVERTLTGGEINEM